MVHCSNCGHKMPEDALFCSQCGTQVFFNSKSGSLEVNLPSINLPDLDLIYVRGGSFEMGCDVKHVEKYISEIKNGNSNINLEGINEISRHNVTLSSYYISKYPVTQRLWKEVLGNSHEIMGDNDNCPINVTWFRVQKFIRELNQLTQRKFRLPTEAEWEFAARGGIYSRNFIYAGSDILNDVSSDRWYGSIGQKQPNELGIHDMTGLVNEWCNDRYSKEYYNSSIELNPKGPDDPVIVDHVMRRRELPVYFRSYGQPSPDQAGFRLVIDKLTDRPTPKISSPNKRLIEDPIEYLGMTYLEGGSFRMGDPSLSDPRQPIHTVILDDFYISKFQVTQKVWEQIMDYNPSNHIGPDLPVECVSWDDVQEFIKWLNYFSKKSFRLPTEAEWEYAATGGNQRKGFSLTESENTKEVVWSELNADKMTHPVAQNNPNELGLFDMMGNGFEWCQDIFWKDYYAYSPSENPKGPNHGKNHVFRGSPVSVEKDMHINTYFRNGFGTENAFPFLGFRLVLPIVSSLQHPKWDKNINKDSLKLILENMITVEAGYCSVDHEFGPEADTLNESDKKDYVEPFALGKFLVTQEIWKAIMGFNPSVFKGDDLPTENISGANVFEFIDRLNTITRKNFRLPTSLEWYFAASGGNISSGFQYSGSNNFDEVAWFIENSEEKTHPVGLKKPNELGFHDMSGNVFEMTLDFNENNEILCCGGSWREYAYWGALKKSAENCSLEDPDAVFGFRLALSI